MSDLIASYAEFSFQHRRDKTTTDDVPANLQTTDLQTAYAVQDILVGKLLKQIGGEKIGYKIGCTSVGAQQLLNTNAPVYGQMFAAWTHQSPVMLPSADFQMIVIEPEFAFTLNADVPAGTYDAESIRPFVANLIPSIEIVHHRLGDWDRFDAPKVIADNAIHGAWIAGKREYDWQHLDLPNHQVTLYADGVEVGAGEGRIALGNPLNALAWLANELPHYGHQLIAGQVVTTGVCMNVYTAQPNEQIVADFGSLGTVEATFIAD